MKIIARDTRLNRNEILGAVHDMIRGNPVISNRQLLISDDHQLYEDDYSNPIKPYLTVRRTPFNTFIHSASGEMTRVVNISEPLNFSDERWVIDRFIKRWLDSIWWGDNPDIGSNDYRHKCWGVQYGREGNSNVIMNILLLELNHDRS